MLSPEQINEIHRLHFVEKWPQRRIARHLHIGRHTLAKYLDTPAPPPSHRDRTSKLDAFKPAVAELLQQDAQAPAQVLFQRLQTLGYDGGITILKDYLQAVRKSAVLRRAYVRMEPSPGDRFDIDWGHFGALTYNGTPRKLYAFCLVECHSRKMYLEFTHSQSFETFVRCHMHAFQTLGGCARELWFDNLATAVAEHEGNLVRFNPRFLAFARECRFIPAGLSRRRGLGKRQSRTRHRICAPELLAVTLLCRSQRCEHAGAPMAPGSRQPAQTSRNRAGSRRPLPARGAAAFASPHTGLSRHIEALVHKDLRLTFDGNRYCVPPRYVGHKLTVKADSSSLTIYDQTHEIVSYARCWERGQTFGAERFQKELYAQMAAAQRSAAQQRLVLLLGPVAESVSETTRRDRSLLGPPGARTVRAHSRLRPRGSIQRGSESWRSTRLWLRLHRQHLRQQRARREVQPPVRLRQPELNDLATDPLSLTEYDAFILQSRKEPCDLFASETESTQSDHDEQATRSDDRRRRD
jgi:transposase